MNQRHHVTSLAPKIVLALGMMLSCGTVASFATPDPIPQHASSVAPTIRGTVVDEEGEPLIGATVMIKGTKTAMATDIDGNFELRYTEKNPVLQVSYVGCQSKEVAVKGQNNITITLSPSSENLDEVVVTALGIKRQAKALGYAVQDLKGKDITEARENNIVNSLSGRFAGVQVSGSGSGSMGSSRIIIRGNNTLAGNNEPLIVVDGVFSMEGDLANLPAIVELKHKYNCSIMVDEAHGLGVFGKNGRGVCDHFGLTDEVDLIMGTFSKSLASIGGFIAGDWDTINFLRHSARTYIFSASNTPAATAAAQKALDILKEEPEIIEKLWDVTNYALKRFKEEGFEIGDTESPIIPLYVRDVEKTFLITAIAFERGVFINPVVPPACAPTDTLVRYALMATHTKEQVDRSVEILKQIFVEQGVIK